MKKTRHFILMLLLFAGCCLPISAQNCMVIDLSDGSTAHFTLAEKPVITYLGENIKAVSATATIEVARSQVRSIRFEEEEESNTAVGEIATENAAIIANGNTITIEGIADGTRVSLFSINGQAVATATATGGSCTIHTDEFAVGIYIINYNNTTIKYLKK